MATLSKITAGQILYKRSKRKLGNVKGAYANTVTEVKINEVFSDCAITDTGRKLCQDDIKKLMVKKPQKRR